MALEGIIKKHYLVFIIILVAQVVVLAFVLFHESGKGTINLKVLEKSKSTIRSPRAVVFESQSKTEELKEKAKKENQKIYRLDNAAYSRQQEVINQIFDQLSEIKKNELIDDALKSERIENLFNEKLSGESINLLLKSDKEKEFRDETLKIILEIHKKELISEENISEVKKQISSVIDSRYSIQEKKILEEIASQLLITNSLVDEELTKTRLEESLQKIEPVYYQLKKDEIIIAKGEETDQLVLEKLEAAGLLSPSFALKERIGLVFLISILTFLLFFYFLKNKNHQVDLSILYSIIFVSASLFALLIRYFYPVKPIVVYFVPVAAAVVILGMLTTVKHGLLTAIYFSIIVSIVTGNLFDVLILHLVTSLLALLLLRFATRVVDFFRSIVLLASLDFSLLISFHLVSGTVTLEKSLQLLIVALGYSLISVLTIFGALILVGIIFKVATLPLLLELANPSSPLLRKLSIKAPGTYHHSLIVGSLSEAAIKKLAGNILIAKVGAYYHDIGKLEKPNDFIENQEKKSLLNIDPKTEAKKIITHVVSGVKIGMKNRLPKEILEIIAGHHGTSVALYYYNLSKSKRENDFRYPGPKPRKKEGAVIMLADSVEAYVRASQGEKDFYLEQAIAKIISDKLNDGQLDYSELTFKELEVIKKSFFEVLKGVYHERIKYES